MIQQKAGGDKMAADIAKELRLYGVAAISNNTARQAETRSTRLPKDRGKRENSLDAHTSPL